MTEMPAAILQKKTIHMQRNSCVMRYSRVVTPASSASWAFAADVVAAAIPCGGSDNKRLTGSRMTAKMIPSPRKTVGRSPSLYTTRTGASSLLNSNAPMPNPMTTVPVASPLRSGNHFATVATGVT